VGSKDVGSKLQTALSCVAGKCVSSSSFALWFGTYRGRDALLPCHTTTTYLLSQQMAQCTIFTLGFSLWETVKEAHKACQACLSSPMLGMPSMQPTYTGQGTQAVSSNNKNTTLNSTLDTHNQCHHSDSRS